MRTRPLLFGLLVSIIPAVAFAESASSSPTSEGAAFLISQAAATNQILSHNVPNDQTRSLYSTPSQSDELITNSNTASAFLADLANAGSGEW